MLLSTAYFPPVSFFALIAKDFTLSPDGVIPSVVYLEACENYQKQSWRNRFRFYAADGPQDLNFPVVHTGTGHCGITEVRVDYSTPWVLRTQRAISAAYDRTPYFDHYRDELFAIMDSRPETLFELNLSLVRFFLKKTGIVADIRLTEEYLPVRSRTEALETGLYGADYRELLHPKRPDTTLADLGLEKPYYQVFARKHGFISNLSIIDLLFNEGPDSISYLKNL
ncbi:MAG: WbqC family protein [Candidatus Cryptobacteroides sp.]